MIIPHGFAASAMASGQPDRPRTFYLLRLRADAAFRDDRRYLPLIGFGDS
jgi:hypothetical protein